MNTKVCPHCKTEKSLTDFYKRRDGKDCSPYCKSCTSIQTLERQRKLKQQSIDYKGGKCLCCGYNRYQGALEFHHLDPEEKEFTLSSVKHTCFDKIKTELDKCILLCSNCHKEIHAGLIFYNKENKTLEQIKNIEYKPWKPNTNYLTSSINIKEIEIKLKNKERITDIAKSLNISKEYLTALLNTNNIKVSKMDEQYELLHPTKIIWPSVEEMSILVFEKPTKQLSKELGISDVAIGKFCKKHNIAKPPRGYWRKKETNKL